MSLLHCEHRRSSTWHERNLENSLHLLRECIRFSNWMESMTSIPCLSTLCIHWENAKQSLNGASAQWPTSCAQNAAGQLQGTLKLVEITVVSVSTTVISSFQADPYTAICHCLYTHLAGVKPRWWGHNMEGMAALLKVVWKEMKDISVRFYGCSPCNRIQTTPRILLPPFPLIEDY